MEVWGLPPWWEGSWAPWHGRAHGRGRAPHEESAAGRERDTVQRGQGSARYRVTDQLSKQE